MDSLTTPPSQLVPAVCIARISSRMAGQGTPLEIALIVLWLLTMIAIPIIRWTVGDDALRWMAMAGVVTQAAAVFAILWTKLDTSRTLQIAVIVLPLSWLLEYVGSSTGLPFGEYHYTAQLVPQVGHVPLIIPLAWLMMLPCAWAVAGNITGQWRGGRFAVISGLAFTAWDLFLDPQMVNWGFWVWAHPGGYFGIPWLNFGGWLVGATCLTWLCAKRVRLETLPRGRLRFIYMITWLLEAGGLLVFWGLPGPALVGFVGMGIFVLLAWRGGNQEQRSS